MMRSGVLRLLSLLVLAPSVFAALPLEDIKTIFAFGDSYTTNGFNPALGLQGANSMATTSGGGSWIQYLANMSNSTAASSYNLAVLGATISDKVVYSNGAGDFASQVASFAQYFPNNSATVPWDPTTTLFAVWFGNDDAYNLASGSISISNYQSAMLTALDTQFHALYDLGARNFMVVDMPTLSQTPAAALFGVNNFESGGAFWNVRLDTYMSVFDTILQGAHSFYLHSSELFVEVLNHPASYGIVNITDACGPYSSIVDQPSFSDPACIVPLAQYFWRDYYHPSWTVHSLLAQQAYNLLSSTTSLIPTPMPTSAAPASNGITAKPAQTSSPAAQVNTTGVTVTKSGGLQLRAGFQALIPPLVLVGYLIAS